MWFLVFPYLFPPVCLRDADVSECAAALPMVERVGLVAGDLRVLGGEGVADLPEKKDRSCGYQ